MEKPRMGTPPKNIREPLHKEAAPKELEKKPEVPKFSKKNFGAEDVKEMGPKDKKAAKINDAQEKEEKKRRKDNQEIPRHVRNPSCAQKTIVEKTQFEPKFLRSHSKDTLNSERSEKKKAEVQDEETERKTINMEKNGNEGSDTKAVDKKESDVESEVEILTSPDKKAKKG